MSRTGPVVVATVLAALLLGGCATQKTADTGTTPTRSTKRDKTLKGAGIGAASGAAVSILAGKRKADQILIGTAIGAGIGAGVGAYMDAQEEKLGRIPGTTVERVSKDTLLVHFDSDVLFPIDSWNLSEPARGMLGDVAGVIAEYPKTAVVIQGHTDSTGSEEHNQTLSEHRANAVEGFLAGRGVDRSRMATIGHGESAPVASNATAEGRQQNRRVEILLKGKAV